MEEALSSIQNSIFTLMALFVLVSFIGYILLPLFLKRFNLSKQLKLTISKLFKWTPTVGCGSFLTHFSQQFLPLNRALYVQKRFVHEFKI